MAGLALAFTTSAHAFDDEITHPLLTQRAAIGSKLDDILKNTMGIANGINATLTDPSFPSSPKSYRIFEWLTIGSTREDADAFCRPSNHFHNPLQLYPSAGMTDVDGYIQAACGGTPYNRRLSSAIWGTRFTTPTTKGEPTGNTADWEAARQAFREAMTLANPQEREAALARTFLYLGSHPSG